MPNFVPVVILRLMTIRHAFRSVLLSKRFGHLKHTNGISQFQTVHYLLGNGQLSKLRVHVNKAQFYLCVQKENAQCLSKCIIYIN